VDPEKIWRLFASEGVTHYCGAPTVQIALANHEKASWLEKEVTTAVGGAPPSPTLLSRFEELNIRPIHLYGLTETYGPNTVCEWHEEWHSLLIEQKATLLARQGQGHITSGLVRVVDENMDDVPRDGETLGELVTRGNTVMKGYFEQPDATAEVFEGSWFHTGDTATWHPDGYVELRDRKKDIIVSGGENISTIEVEQTVDAHPAVLESAVVAVPDEKWGERPKAFVTLKPGHSATEEEIIAFCRERLAHFKCPDAVKFSELPKTATGKVQKFVLREREWAGRERRIG
jgi:fatty-acyl-CoA synthase